MEEECSLQMFFLGIVIGCVLGVMIILICLNNDLIINQEVGNDICYQLTGNKSIASVEDGKLVCEIPSFDSTQNIIVRSNSD